MTERFDMTLFMAWLLALAVGMVMVASASVSLAEHAWFYASRHGVYLAGGLCAFAVTLAIPLRFWEAVHRPCLLLAILGCAAVLVPSIGHEVNGSRRWISLGFITVQASEVAKLLLLVYLAGYLSRVRSSLRDDVLVLVRPLGWVGLVLLLILLEPDFGTVVVLSVLTGGLLFIANVRMLHFVVIALVAASGLLLLAVVQPYRAERLATFLDPWPFAFGSGYQLTQALIAFGRGEFFGLGLGDGVQKLFYLPEAHNDFIFAVIAEELGMVGSVLVFGLLMFIVMRVFRVAKDAMVNDRIFPGYLAYGAGLLIGVQVLINVGVNTGVLPTKGLTLPFISYGGNSLLICSVLMGLAFRVSHESSTRDGHGQR